MNNWIVWKSGVRQSYLLYQIWRFVPLLYETDEIVIDETGYKNSADETERYVSVAVCKYLWSVLFNESIAFLGACCYTELNVWPSLDVSLSIYDVGFKAEAIGSPDVVSRFFLCHSAMYLLSVSHWCAIHFLFKK